MNPCPKELWGDFLRAQTVISDFCGYAANSFSIAGGQTVTPRGSVASLCMARAKLNAHTYTTKSRPIPDRGPSGRDGWP